MGILEPGNKWVEFLPWWVGWVWFTVGKLGLQIHLVVIFQVPECIVGKNILGCDPVWNLWLTESPHGAIWRPISHLLGSWLHWIPSILKGIVIHSDRNRHIFWVWICFSCLQDLFYHHYLGGLLRVWFTGVRSYILRHQGTHFSAKVWKRIHDHKIHSSYYVLHYSGDLIEHWNRLLKAQQKCQLGGNTFEGGAILQDTVYQRTLYVFFGIKELYMWLHPQ